MHVRPHVNELCSPKSDVNMRARGEWTQSRLIRAWPSLAGIAVALNAVFVVVSHFFQATSAPTVAARALSATATIIAVVPWWLGLETNVLRLLIKRARCDHSE